MASKFVDLKEAARMIAVTPEELIDMRSKGDIFGYRDGASWKFKLEEVERVIGERRAGGTGDSQILSANDEEFENMISGLSSKILAEKAQEESESGSVLISEEELGVSATGQSTIIGKGRKPEDAAGESDLRLADESGKDPLGSGSDKLLEAPGSKLDLAASASDVLHGSDLKIATGSGGTGDMPMSKSKSGSGTGDMPGSKGGGTGEMPRGKAGSALDLGSNLSLGDEGDLEMGSDSALDEEIKPKSGSGKGSDVTLGSGDSGINLSPSDSGLSLEEEPLDLGGSGVESLELPEDDDVIALETEAADPDQATQLKADNEFLLSPGEGAQEDESDSGSQVIALEDSESFDQEAATMLKSEGALAAEFQPVGMEAGAMGQPVYVQVPTVETPYSIWNVLSLGLVVMLLCVSGMMMMDIMFNMWSFSGTTSVTTGIMDAFLSILNMS